jgi:pre-60S factor REI1
MKFSAAKNGILPANESSQLTCDRSEFHFISRTQSTMAAMFTCISCRVAFKDAEIQRLHYKTDWHRYNLKRKIAELPPVTAEDFQRRVLQHKETADAQSQDVSMYCEPCRKTFSSQNAFDNHLQSKKHKDASCNFVPNQNENQVSGSAGINKSKDTSKVAVPRSIDDDNEDSEAEEVDSDEWESEDVEIKDCLFCEHHSASIYKNLKHMSTAHSFFIPDFEFVTDVKALMEYLGGKVKEGFMCLWCSNNNKAFWSVEATQQHMRDKGHCKIMHEGAYLAEFIDFYDYTTSYPDKPEGDEDMEVEVPELDGSDYQLTLPSGATIGHRSLFNYFQTKPESQQHCSTCETFEEIPVPIQGYWLH